MIISIIFTDGLLAIRDAPCATSHCVRVVVLTFLTFLAVLIVAVLALLTVLALLAMKFVVLAVLAKHSMPILSFVAGAAAIM